MMDAEHQTVSADVEIVLSDEFSIVSITDLHGNISYANPYFVEVSGFSAQELIGAPQNILRHPDMPAEVFSDLWLTIKSGHTWTGMVKNLTKSGAYYWVLANVTPVYENGDAVGYMSVRTKPSREQVLQADAAYKEFRAGNPRKLSIQDGRVVRNSMFGKVRRFGLAARLRLSLVAAMLAFAFLVLHTAWPALPLATDALAMSVAGLGSVAMIHIAWSLQFQVLRPLLSITRDAHIMAGGDLTKDIAAADQSELGQLQNALRQSNINLRSIIGDVRSNFESIHLSTQEIASGHTDLSARTESQTASLEQTAVSLDQFTGTVQQSAHNAAKANTLAVEASAVARKSGDIVHHVVTTMHDISSASKKIDGIVGVIEGIAFQTSILALNAAVEEARASEQGRGFAEVATEVRSLAGRTAVAAKEIKLLIDTSLSKVGLGTALADQAGAAMQQVIDATARVTEIMAAMSGVTHEQCQGLAQVSKVVSQLDTVTQHNAVLVGQAAGATGSLSDQTEHLSGALAIFKLPGRDSSIASSRHEVPSAPALNCKHARGRNAGC